MSAAPVPWFDLGLLKQRWPAVVAALAADEDDRLVLYRSIILDVVERELVVGATRTALARLTDRQLQAFGERIERLLGIGTRIRFVRRFVGES